MPISHPTADPPKLRERVAPLQGADASATTSAVTGTPVDHARSRTEVLVVVGLAVGLMLRFAQYAFGRSLWLDELLMVPGIVDRSWSDLLHPAGWGAVPPGFTLLSKLSVDALGNNEYALRLLPFAAGVGSLFLFLRVARRLLTPGAVPLATWLFALAPFLIYYSSELKPYSTDALVALLLLLFAADLLRNGISARRGALWVMGSVCAAAFSLPSLFVSIGTTGVLLLRAVHRGTWGEARVLAGVAALLALIFGVPYLLFLSGIADALYLRTFWSTGFMPFPPRSLPELAWFPNTFVRIFRDPLGVIDDAQSASGFYQAAAGMFAFAVGAVWMWRERRATLALLLAPALLALLASGLKRYPFGAELPTGGRVLLFLVPALLLVMAEGLAQFRDGVRGSSLRAVPLLVAALLILPSVAHALIAVPYGRVELKPLLAYVAQNRQPGDRVYVNYDVRHAFTYYASRYGVAKGEYVLGPCARFEPRRYLEALSELRGNPRVWVLFGGGTGVRRFNERDFMVDFLDRVGRRIDNRAALGTSAYLYDLRPEAAPAGDARVPVPVLPHAIEEGCALWE